MTPHPLIDRILMASKEALSGDYEKYQNHVCRVYLLCTVLDNNPVNRDRYAIAAAFHDLGIWTHRTYDYLAPSLSNANSWLIRNGFQEWGQEIALMIDMHHKITAYSGVFNETVEVFRKADWADVSLGLISFGISRSAIAKIHKDYPGKGFHRFLAKKAIRNLFVSPGNPLPMFRK